MSAGAAFRRDTAMGSFTIEPVDPGRDAETVHAWLTHPNSAFWQMGGLDVDGVRDYLATVERNPHERAWLGRRDGAATFYAETYDPTRMLLTEVHDGRPGDVGMHLLVAPPTGVGEHGLTSAVMETVVRFVFGALDAERIVVEPDVRNTRIAAKNAEVGFEAVREVELADKRATLALLDRDGFNRSIGAAAHLHPAAMSAAHRHLAAKTIAELTHERLLAPMALDDGSWSLELDDGRVRYRFRAEQRTLEHLEIDPDSLGREVSGMASPIDVLDLMLELQSITHVPSALLPVYLEELSSTLASHAYKQHRGGPSAAWLAAADFQVVESAMTEGHPSFIANNGRIGFGLDEYRRYAPETGNHIRLVWLAARKSLSHLALSAEVVEDRHYEAELDPEDRVRFAGALARLGLDPDEYRLLPVHPWQWQHRVPITFAADLGRRDLVYVGESTDRFQPQQSIRTFYNRSRPDRSYVKTAVAVQNMGFLRGLSPAYMEATPAINDWVFGLVAADPTLREARFEVLREHAAIGYTGDVFHRTPDSSPYRKMLAALWRESPTPRLGSGERVVTLAALLHRDPWGAAVVTALIRASALEPTEWVSCRRTTRTSSVATANRWCCCRPTTRSTIPSASTTPSSPAMSACTSSSAGAARRCPGSRSASSTHSAGSSSRSPTPHGWSRNPMCATSAPSP